MATENINKLGYVTFLYQHKEHIPFLALRSTGQTWEDHPITNFYTKNLSDPCFIKNKRMYMPIGKFLVNSFAQASLCGRHRIRLYDNVTDTILIEGLSTTTPYYASTNYPPCLSTTYLQGVINLVQEAELSIQHYVEYSCLGWAFGFPTNYPTIQNQSFSSPMAACTFKKIK